MTKSSTRTRIEYTTAEVQAALGIDASQKIVSGFVWPGGLVIDVEPAPPAPEPADG